jgi:hypothetical protein
MLETGYNYVSKLEAIKENIDLVIQDIDKGAWAMRNHVELLKLVLTRESVVQSATI